MAEMPFLLVPNNLIGRTADLRTPACCQRPLDDGGLSHVGAHAIVLALPKSQLTHLELSSNGAWALHEAKTALLVAVKQHRKILRPMPNVRPARIDFRRVRQVAQEQKRLAEKIRWDWSTLWAFSSNSGEHCRLQTFLPRWVEKTSLLHKWRHPF